ncbi:hypothetical protein [Streptomyces sp. NPDC058268]|uniref:hypothetical protein n=1 Tax=Streptomyces sp. NPDC058268 TaxID=3346413 RepID=UPI0036EC7257
MPTVSVEDKAAQARLEALVDEGHTAGLVRRRRAGRWPVRGVSPCHVGPDDTAVQAEASAVLAETGAAAPAPVGTFPM